MPPIEFDDELPNRDIPAQPDQGYGRQHTIRASMGGVDYDIFELEKALRSVRSSKATRSRLAEADGTSAKSRRQLRMDSLATPSRRRPGDERASNGGSSVRGGRDVRENQHPEGASVPAAAATTAASVAPRQQHKNPTTDLHELWIKDKVERFDNLMKSKKKAVEKMSNKLQDHTNYDAWYMELTSHLGEELTSIVKGEETMEYARQQGYDGLTASLFIKRYNVALELLEASLTPTFKATTLKGRHTDDPAELRIPVDPERRALQPDGPHRQDQPDDRRADAGPCGAVIPRLHQPARRLGRRATVGRRRSAG